MPSYLFLFFDQLLTAEEITAKTGLQDPLGIAPDILADFYITLVPISVDGEPNEPWTQLSAPIYNSESHTAISTYTYIPLVEAKTIAKQNLAAQANSCCKNECCKAELELDPLLLSSINSEGAILGPLKQQLDSIATTLELSLQAVEEAETVPEIISVVETAFN